MRALRILIVLVVILGGLFVIADRVAVHFAQGEVADKVKARENLSQTPDVDIKGFPFLTQVAGGSLDDVEIGIKGFTTPAAGNGASIRIDDLRADMQDVRFSGDYSSATAARATGTATISYDELMKAAKTEPTDLGVFTAQVAGLSYGGDGKLKVAFKVSVLPKPVYLKSSLAVEGDQLKITADGLPQLGALSIAESKIRSVTDFRQAIDRLPGGVKLDQVRATPDGLRITVKGTDVKLGG
ncbi:DUF2993 domain-containing protein [Streptomyces sp. NPDC026659]|uniref:LmeA family phospholipid-binding protein n=1 Tax=Streptomyces sp. NPDC026659 TaxID=3155123 RepID=UPI0033D52175